MHLQATQHDDDSGAGGIRMHGDLPRSGPETIVAFNIGLGFTQQGHRPWRVDVGGISRLAMYQAMQQVQHMRLGRAP
jgi:hypothetical protein